ncbi:MAG TPA: zinc ribbon domain-containing protein [Symbiobacteriaceae bacterium]|nr:zinc ribbon domain-containing protein [Symbiobacteriaceae bacterium]
MNWKRIVARTAIIFSILAVVGIGVGRLFLDQWHRFEPIPTDPSGPIIDQIERHGLTPVSVTAVHDLTLPEGIGYLYVAETTLDRTALIANPPSLEGKPISVLHESLIQNHLQGSETLAVTPDGHEYAVGIAIAQPVFPYRVGVPAFITGLAAAVLAWVALAVWIYLDARSSGSVTAIGWGLLGLLAAPLALAVWIISRRSQGPVEPVVCPGCGSDTPKDAVFCVRCGHGLRPTCPECRRPVETDWGYCGACGANLSE